MITPNQISSLGNRISWSNDIAEELIIDSIYNELPEVFEAIILSGMPEQSNSPNVGSSTPAEVQVLNDNRYYFMRVRPLLTTELIIPNPFYASNLQEAKRLINMHPLAYIEVNNSVHPPTHGDVYECRYTRDDKLGIALIDRVRNSGFKIGKVANRNLHKAYGNMSPVLQGQAQGTQSQPSQGNNNYSYNYKVPNTNHLDTFDENNWKIMLEQVIALGATGKKCSWGKRYDEVCPADGRGIVGIAHWQTEPLNKLVDEIVSQLGEQKIVDWFGRSSEELKRVNEKCASKRCYYNVGWWKTGWESFVKHPDTKKIQGVVWKRKYYDPALKFVKKYSKSNPSLWQVTDRNVCILVGIKNSAGNGGIYRYAEHGKNSPDKTLENYVNHEDHRHREKRANAINKHFP
jgi:hypothetical protein